MKAKSLPSTLVFNHPETFELRIRKGYETCGLKGGDRVSIPNGEFYLVDTKLSGSWALKPAQPLPQKSFLVEEGEPIDEYNFDSRTKHMTRVERITAARELGLV